METYIEKVCESFEEKLLNEWVNQIDLDDILRARDFLTSKLKEAWEMGKKSAKDELWTIMTTENLKNEIAAARKEAVEEIFEAIEKVKISFPDYKNEDNRGREAMRVAWNEAIKEIKDKIKDL